MKRNLFILTGIIIVSILVLNKFVPDINLKQEISNLLSIELSAPNEPVEQLIGEYYEVENGILISVFEEKLDFEFVIQKPNFKDGQIKFSTENLGDDNTLLLINSSYFTKEFVHVGLLVADGEVEGSLSINNPQATHVLELEPELKIYTTEEFNRLPNSYLKPNHNLIQTGPLVIKNNEVQDSFIENSLNGNTQHLRSLVGFTESGKVVLISTKKFYSLKELAEKVMTHESMKNENLTLLNLDGGSSTSIYSFENISFSYGKDKKLPYYIKVSKPNL